MSRPRDTVGHAKTVLVFGEGDVARAVISSVGVRTQDEPGPGALRLAGPVVLDKSVVSHLENVVVPLAKEILTRLGVPLPALEISVANVGAASTHDVGMRIRGLSADVPVFLAIVSAALNIPIPQDVVSTGHIASTSGEIRMVKSLPAKLTAAISAKAVRVFVHPALDSDTSLHVLSPLEKDRIEMALAQARNDLHTVAVQDAQGLLAAVFREEEMLKAALRNGYYLLERRRRGKGTPIERATGVLYENLKQRFWRCLEHNLLARTGRAANDLLLERIRFHVRQEAYPSGLGGNLLEVLQSLPRSTRRLKIKFPLVPKEDCLHLVKLAYVEDFDDVRKLFDAIAGDRLTRRPRVVQDTTGMEPDKTPNTLLDNTLSEISSEALSSNVGLPIDEARASYSMDSVTVESSEEFYNLVSSFYLHLLLHTRNLEPPTDKDKARPEAYALLDRTFVQQGGAAGAYAEGRDAIHGGMRYVLDAMTMQFMREAKEKHVNAVFKETLGTMPWEERVAFMKALLERLRSQLPSEICDESPERFVHKCEPIARAYVESLEGVRQLLRTL